MADAAGDRSGGKGKRYEKQPDLGRSCTFSPRPTEYKGGAVT